MYTIKNDYNDKLNNSYDNINNIHFDIKEDMKGNLGTLITETKHEEGGLFFSSDEELKDGVYIYKTKYDPSKALRIYKDWADYKYTSHESDTKLISELLKRQTFVKLTDFPTGIVTLENSVIGQEIPLYEGYKDLIKIIQTKEKEQIIKYYNDMIKILEELYNAEIIYIDCHTKNFLINEITDEVKLIDFEPSQIILKKDIHNYKKMLNILKQNINRINQLKNISFELKTEETLEDIRETILSKKL